MAIFQQASIASLYMVKYIDAYRTGVGRTRLKTRVSYFIKLALDCIVIKLNSDFNRSRLVFIICLLGSGPYLLTVGQDFAGFFEAALAALGIRLPLARL